MRKTANLNHLQLLPNGIFSSDKTIRSEDAKYEFD